MFWMRSTTNQKRQEQRRHVHNPMNSCWNVSSVEYFLTSLPGVMHEHLSLFCSRRSAALLSELKINHEFVSLYHLWTSECDSSSQNMALLSITLLRSSVHNIFFLHVMCEAPYFQLKWVFLLQILFVQSQRRSRRADLIHVCASWLISSYARTSGECPTRRDVNMWKCEWDSSPSPERTINTEHALQV